MTKFLRVAFHEYTRHVFRRRFLFALLSVPGFFVVMALVGLLIYRMESKVEPAGYVDHSGLLADPIPAPTPSPPDQPLPLVAFQSEAQAREALQNEEILAYYVLPDDYLQTSRAKLVYLEEPSSSAENQFEDFLRVNLLSEQSRLIFQRVTQGAQLTVRSADGSRQMMDNDWFSIFTPFLVGLGFIAAIFTTSGYLTQAVVEEKENLTMEIIITSISPFQMMGGKIIGIIGIGMTQLLFWVGLIFTGVLIGRDLVEFLRVFHIAPATLLLMVMIMVPGFVLFAALMATVGATVTEAREGQQIASLFTLPAMVPFWFTFQIMNNPNGPLAIGLSFFPLTAPVALSMRAGFTLLPFWEVALSVGVLVISALGALWLAGRAFRLGMLRYGQRLSWRELFSKSA